MTIAELKALPFDDQIEKMNEQESVWRRSIQLRKQHKSARTPEEKTALLAEFEAIIDGADLIVP